MNVALPRCNHGKQTAPFLYVLQCSGSGGALFMALPHCEPQFAKPLPFFIEAEKV